MVIVEPTILDECPYCSALVCYEMWMNGNVINTYFACGTVAPLDDVVEQSDKCKQGCT